MEDNFWSGFLTMGGLVLVVLFTLFLSQIDRPYFVDNPLEGERCTVLAGEILDCYRDETVGKGE